MALLFVLKKPVHLGLGVSGWLLTISEASTEDKRNTHVWSLSHVSLFLLSGRGDVVKMPVLYPGDTGYLYPGDTPPETYKRGDFRNSGIRCFKPF